MDEVERREVLEKQLTMTPMTCHMRARGVTESTPLKVDLFFYAPTEAHARALAGELRHDHGFRNATFSPVTRCSACKSARRRTHVHRE